ncbi:MAG TPA: serine/threonine-protein kinase [Kofleriaceae bacterium]|jgi:serine/threonine protein kinase|nr:serine/threonine-protein kinase [Kofleriaceae bacterium]
MSANLKLNVPVAGEPYRIVKVLGAGAAGEVYLVENHRAQRLEALKILKKVEQSEADLVAQGRFKREVRAAQLLSHQNIVATYDCGQLADGRPFLTMEYVEGVSLHSLLQQRGPLPIPMVIGIIAEIADALYHAHLAGVVHRDIKPHNLVLANHPDGQIVRVLDFGMAKILGGHETMVLSADGAIFGTPKYMSPEQCRGLPPDPRTDIYALGCVAFELLLGEAPFKGALAPMFMHHMKTPPRVPSQVDPEAGIPPELDALILRCLEKAPEKRFQSGADLCAAAQSVPGYRPLRSPKNWGAHA